MKQNIFKFILLLTVVILNINCAYLYKQNLLARALGTENDELRYKYIEKSSFPQEREKIAQGDSLYPGDTNFSNLFTDNKAKHINDSIKVNIIESVTAEGSANTGLERSSKIKASMPALFGLEKHVPSDVNMSNLVESSMENSFDGKGEITRKGKVQATVSARVTDVYPNGDLMIFGKQKIQINAEKQIITVKGIVRPSDIKSDNSIDSTQIANADIEVTGRGVMNDKQRPGIGMRILDWLWLF